MKRIKLEELKKKFETLRKKNENGYGKGITKAPAIAHEQLKNEKLKISEDILTSVCNNMHS